LETSLPLRTVKRGNSLIPKVIKSYNQNKWIKTNINKHKKQKAALKIPRNKTGPTHKNKHTTKQDRPNVKISLRTVE
jgi:hypothetical protein